MEGYVIREFTHTAIVCTFTYTCTCACTCTCTLKVNCVYTIRNIDPYDVINTFQAFATNRRNSVETIDERFQKTIGQRVEVTFRDKQMINEAYCKGKGPFSFTNN